MGVHPIFTVTRAKVLKMISSSPICTPHIVSNSLQPCLTIHVGILYERFNCTLLDLIKTLPKEQKANWPLHILSLVFTYNVMPHSITGYQPYDLMFGCKAPTVVMLGFSWPVTMTRPQPASVPG